MRRRTFLAAAGASAVAALAGCASGSAAPAEGADYDVGMSSVNFVPDEVTVSTGETVVWRNTGSRNHTVTAYEATLPDGAEYFASGGYDSEMAARHAWKNGLQGAVHSGQTFEHTFEVAGEYHYFCIPHEAGGMAGKVVVTE